MTTEEAHDAHKEAKMVQPGDATRADSTSIGSHSTGCSMLEYPVIKLIRDLHSAYTTLQSSPNPVSIGRKTFYSRDEIEEYCRALPVAVYVRGGWYSPRAVVKPMYPEEFLIHLPGGGPSYDPAVSLVRLVGDLFECQRGVYTPINLQVEVCEWGSPWKELQDYDDDVRDALFWFVRLFAYAPDVEPQDSQGDTTGL